MTFLLSLTDGTVEETMAISQRGRQRASADTGSSFSGADRRVGGASIVARTVIVVESGRGALSAGLKCLTTCALTA